MGGLILAYNQITGSRDGTGKEVLIGLASQLRGSLSNWTVQHEPGNPTDGSQLKITFTMPASERVEVSIPTGIGIVAGVMGRDADDQMWYPSYAEQQAALTASNQPAGRDKWRLDSMAFHFSLSENSASYVPAGDRNLMEKCALYYDNTATGMGHLNPTPWVITGSAGSSKTLYLAMNVETAEVPDDYFAFIAYGGTGSTDTNAPNFPTFIMKAVSLPSAS